MKGISVIIPTYNRQDLIAEAIQSVIDQNFKGEIEIIISDDGSRDKTLKIAESFGNRVRIIKKNKHDQGQGAARTRNRGLHLARYSYIAFLDSDDIYLPGHLNRIMSVLENNSEIDFAFCRSLQFKEVDGVKLFKPWTQEKISKKDLLNPVVSGGNVVNTNSFLLKKEIFEIVGGFNEEYATSEDGDMWMRISEKFKSTFADYFGVAYRIDDRKDQLTSDSRDRICHFYQIVNEEAIKRYYRLGLRNSYRIYKLKVRRSNLKNKQAKLKHYIYCLFLSFKYPVAFLQAIPSLIKRFLPNIKKDTWNELSFYKKSF